MILTKRAHLRYFQHDFNTRLKSYKRFRKPKRVKPYSTLISFVAGAGELCSTKQPPSKKVGLEESPYKGH